jgi:hypothetical protein
VNEADFAFDDDRKEVDEAFDVRAPSEARVELAGAERAVAGTVEDGLELVFIEQGAEAAVVLGVAGDNACAGEGPVVFLANSDDLARISVAEVVKGVVARDAGDAGDEEGEGRRILGVGFHRCIIRELQGRVIVGR